MGAVPIVAARMAVTIITKLRGMYKATHCSNDVAIWCSVDAVDRTTESARCCQ